MQIAVLGSKCGLGAKQCKTADQHGRRKFTAKKDIVLPSHWSNSPLAPRTRSIRPRRHSKTTKARAGFKCNSHMTSQIRSDQVSHPTVASCTNPEHQNSNISSFCFTAGLRTLNNQSLPLLDKAVPALGCLGP